ncbi:hypothetical protein E6R60_18925 [Streptomyces sp. A0642]|nr:hypothetical protein E6R60_18925 [Streptomyces sp. A0642]
MAMVSGVLRRFRPPRRLGRGEETVYVVVGGLGTVGDEDVAASREAKVSREMVTGSACGSR